ncbi:hypothetical protein KTC92_08155 [Clostridium sp. CM027]|uniref:TolB family protein n=1 Tax=Clostridium sp. CM027 TaxID=2849865 RepID=UPI001C6E28A1|nr:hypothetical protein [Clostridium sp. CM027]MBW9145556.1 hypothetical protein [Clostridium sp. CM027]UVE42388.1 hypothetical protein KTC92_08155 [Clostridium sp. CM027]
MINIKVKVESLTITMLLLAAIGITSGCPSKISKSEKSIGTFKLQNTAIKKTPDIKSMNAVVIRKNELLLVSLNDKNDNITLDSGGTFSHPLISPDKSLVSYMKDSVLYITTDKLEHIKVVDNASQLSFAWQDKNTLLYSPTTGGLYVYDVVNKISKPYLQNEFNYQNITLDSKGRIYAEQYLYYKKNGSDYRNDYGILFFDPIAKTQKIVIKSIPSKIDTVDDLGMYPIIIGISNDDKYLYIWKHPHAGSLAADGVDLAVYDISQNKLIEYTNPNIVSLGYSDNISPNPKNSNSLALIYGGGREMGNNKDLVVLDILTGKFQSLSPKGETTMTPYYTNDGNTILYASSKEQKYVPSGLTQWLLNGQHHIFSIDTTTKQIKQLTNNQNYFDFSPIYINNKDIIFFRSDKSENVSIWKYANGQETMLADGFIFYDDMDYPAQNYFGHFNTTQYTDIR